MNIQKPRLATPEDFQALAVLIRKECSVPETQCIHSATGESVETICDEIARWNETGEITFAVLEKDGEIVAAAGCEFDVNLERGWLRGPFAPEENWAALARRVYNTLMANLSPKITRLDTFLNQENVRGQKFYADLEFEEKSRAHVYVAENPGLVAMTKVKIAPRCRPVSDPFHIPLANLHDAIFSETYYTGEEILSKVDDDHRVYIFTEGDEVLGYLFGVIEPEAEEGYVEFIGVREDARGRGIGGDLLRTALNWFFVERNMPQAGLTVADTNVNARGLYERVGYRLKYTGVNQRKEGDT